MRSLLIPADIEIPILLSERHPRELAQEMLHTDLLDVVSVRGYQGPRHVMYIDDFGKSNKRPINRRAWALYNGSPIYGDAVLTADSESGGGVIAEGLAALVAGVGFPPPESHEAMDRWLAAHDEQ